MIPGCVTLQMEICGPRLHHLHLRTLPVRPKASKPLISLQPLPLRLLAKVFRGIVLGSTTNRRNTPGSLHTRPPQKKVSPLQLGAMASNLLAASTRVERWPPGRRAFGRRRCRFLAVCSETSRRPPAGHRRTERRVARQCRRASEGVAFPVGD